MKQSGVTNRKEDIDVQAICKRERECGVGRDGVYQSPITPGRHL